MELTRRDMLKLSVLGGAAMLLPFERVVSAKGPDLMAASKLPKPFTNQFVVPPTLTPTLQTATADYYDLHMTMGSAEIIPGYRTPVWGYNGSVPGPTVNAYQGREVVMRHCNELPVSNSLGYRPNASVHLHGSPSQPQFDGYASDEVYPQEWKEYHYLNPQEARTLWYHDHGAHHTSSNAYMGLAAMYRLYDDQERALPLPEGPYDVPLIVTDAQFTAKGDLYMGEDESGTWGNVILVNGRPWPVMKVERRKYRFRLLNASISRSYRWVLDSGEPFTVVGTDGGLMPQPQVVNSFRHSSAERYEVIIDFSKYPIGRRVTLQNLSNPNNRDEANTGKIMAFDVVSDAATLDNNDVPDVLNPHNPAMLLRPSDSLRERTFKLERKNSQWTVNGKTWKDIEASGFEWTAANPDLGDVEIWTIENSSGGWYHPFHIHLIDFQVIDRNGQAPMPHERGPKDVVYVGENEKVKVLMRFGPHKGRYMIHCHNLVHEDHDMMSQFEVGSGGEDPIKAAPARPMPAPPYV